MVNREEPKVQLLGLKSNPESIFNKRMTRPGFHPSGTIPPFVVFLMAASLSLQTAQSSRDSSQMIHILVFGDSLSEGLFLKSSEAWPALITPKLRQAGLAAEILNVSKSG